MKSNGGTETTVTIQRYRMWTNSILGKMDTEKENYTSMDQI